MQSLSLSANARPDHVDPPNKSPSAVPEDYSSYNLIETVSNLRNLRIPGCQYEHLLRNQILSQPQSLKWVDKRKAELFKIGKSSILIPWQQKFKLNVQVPVSGPRNLQGEARSFEVLQGGFQRQGNPR